MLRISRFPEQLLEGEATPADVGSVLEDRGIPRRQCGRREADDLPEGEIQGMIASTTPSGWKDTKLREASLSTI